MRIGVLGDVHSCAETYEIALKQVQESGCDVTIILGDLFTYGLEPQKVIDLTHDAIARGSVLIRGNHDQIYIDRIAGGSNYEKALPEWIKESIQWTCDQIGAFDFNSTFNSQESWSYSDLFIAHANPYRYGDWTYLSSNAAFDSAQSSLKSRGFLKGIFGHTHRFFDFNNQHDGVRMVTVGSLGQPRSREKLSEWCLVDLDGAIMSVEQRLIEHSWDTELAAIDRSPLSTETKAQLSKFFLS